jgi:hypothetical protein
MCLDKFQQLIFSVTRAGPSSTTRKHRPPIIDIAPSAADYPPRAMRAFQ